MHKYKAIENGVVTDELCTWIDLEGSIDKVVNRLHEEQQRYAVDYDNIRLSKEQEPYDEGYRYVLVGDRPPTEAEKAEYERVKVFQQKQHEEWDKKKLAELKAKYEPEDK